MKLFRVSIELDIVVAADTPEEAEAFVANNKTQIFSEADPEIFALEVFNANQLPSFWESDHPVWNGKGLTVGQWIK